jgi:hypothetical protein
MPAEGGLPLPTPTTSIPWEDRGRYGFFGALIETTKQLLMTPTDFFKAMPVTGGMGAPLLYAVIVGTMATWVGLLYQAVQTALLGGGAFRLPSWVAALQGTAVLGIVAVMAPLLVVIGVFIGAGISHVILLLFGGARRGFEATFRVMAYSVAPGILAIVPFCGGVVGGVWRLVLQIIGLAEAHGISKGLAAVAVLLPILLVCCCCAAGGFLAGASMASLMRGMAR